ncbi:MAG: FHA domain-containing protein [Pyrinomonadaceae bacterium]
MPEVTLTFYDAGGNEQQVNVAARRFSIGRLPENDLAIEDSNLSRRHAMIENFDGRFLISDCGSQNGTEVNGLPVTSAIELADGDLITLGGSCDITVRVRAVSTQAVAQSNQVPSTAQNIPAALFAPYGSNVTAEPARGAESKTSSTLFSPPLIAVACAVLIMIVAALIVIAYRRSGTQPNKNITVVNRRGQSNQDAGGSADEQTNQINSSNDVSDGADTGSVDGGSAGVDELDEIERYALRVMRSISNDSNPTISRKVLAEVNEKIKSYRGSAALRDNLRAIKQRGAQQLGPAAKAGNVKLPLLVYAALARMDRDGERGDPVAAAQRMLPVIAHLRGLFGTELANDALLIIAAYDQGPGGTTHPLQTTVIELAKRQPESPATIRTVWYLRDHQRLSPRSYELVLRFLAIGVIAQDPHKFGVDAEPLGF